MTSRKKLLSNLLQPLLEEWGHEEIEVALRSLANLSTVGASQDRQIRQKAKPLASDQVVRMELPEPQASILRDLAARFDRKQFLPSVADVREFMVMAGERPVDMKDRSEAFRRLLPMLTLLPPDRLERLANNAQHSGPTRLAPLSDAIGTAAASLPRYIRQDKEAA